MEPDREGKQREILHGWVSVFHVGCCSNGLSDDKKRCTSFPGNPPLPRDSNAHRSGRVRGGRGRERIKSPTTCVHRRSFPLARPPCSFFVLFPWNGGGSVSFLPRTSLGIYPPSVSLTLSLLILAPDAPRKEMCLCLDSRQIICGNKFLCVQCYVIGFISLTARHYISNLLASIRGDR